MQWLYPSSSSHPKRQYQVDICRECLCRNTLVCLPTGLGKTLIAAVAICNYYHWYPKGKIVFMAPTKPLVMQQLVACHKLMGIPDVDSVILEGSTPKEKRYSLWKQKRVFFCTPQTVLNDLVSDDLDASAIVLVVFDEAHRATGNYSYCQVMQALETRAGCGAFRVIALSATPGSDKRAIQNVLYNLNIEHIEVRTEDDEEIVEHTHLKHVEFIDTKTPLLSIEERAIRAMHAIMASSATTLCSLGVLISDDCSGITNHVIEEALARRNRLALSQSSLTETNDCLDVLRLLVKWRSELRCNGPASLRQQLARKTQADEQHCRRHVEQSSAYANLVGILHNASSSRHVKQLSNPKMDSLKQVLEEHFSRKGVGDSRVIVFCHLRLTVAVVVDELASLGTIRASAFVGQSSKQQAENDPTVNMCRGLNQREQKEVLERFNRGECNVLVATSIAEEGLDIHEVDLIVFYDSVASPVRLVQRMGRTGRKRSGRVVVLVGDSDERAKMEQSCCTLKSIGSFLHDDNYRLSSKGSLRIASDASELVMVDREARGERFAEEAGSGLDGFELYKYDVLGEDSTRVKANAPSKTAPVKTLESYFRGGLTTVAPKPLTRCGICQSDITESAEQGASASLCSSCIAVMAASEDDVQLSVLSSPVLLISQPAPSMQEEISYVPNVVDVAEGADSACVDITPLEVQDGMARPRRQLFSDEYLEMKRQLLHMRSSGGIPPLQLLESRYSALAGIRLASVTSHVLVDSTFASTAVSTVPSSSSTTSHLASCAPNPLTIDLTSPLAAMSGVYLHFSGDDSQSVAGVSSQFIQIDSETESEGETNLPIAGIPPRPHPARIPMAKNPKRPIVLSIPLVQREYASPVPRELTTPISAALSPSLSTLVTDDRSSTSVGVESDEMCCVCMSRDSSEENPIVFCDGGCGGVCHIECYGLPSVPVTEFICEGCSSLSSVCVLCKVRGGILKRSECGQWTHPVCVLFVSELTVSADMRANNIHALNKERASLVCYVCRQGGGVVQCSAASCYLAYHPYCALTNAQQLITRQRVSTQAVCYDFFCMHHWKNVNMNGFELISSVLEMSYKNDANIDGSFAVEDTPVNAIKCVRRKRLRKKGKELNYQSKRADEVISYSAVCYQASKRDKKSDRVEKYIDCEAALSGSASSDEESITSTVLSGDFINDGAYTQISNAQDDNFALYHRVDREVFCGDSPELFDFAFGRNRNMRLRHLERALQSTHAQNAQEIDDAQSDVSYDVSVCNGMTSVRESSIHESCQPFVATQLSTESCVSPVQAKSPIGASDNSFYKAYSNCIASDDFPICDW